MHDLPTTASESARLHRELLNIFDFTRVGGAEPEFGFEERVRRLTQVVATSKKLTHSRTSRMSTAMRHADTSPYTTKT